MAKRKEEQEQFDIRLALSDSVDDVSRRLSYEESSLEAVPPMSTGMLAMDLVYGGGLRPGMLTHAGEEQTAKTTAQLTIMASAIKHDIPLIAFSDYEGSTRSSKNYVHEILKNVGVKMNMDEVFGKKDDQGKWVVTPRVRYRAEAILEKFYDWLHSILQILPDKRLVGKNWWLIYEDTKENKAKYGEFSDPSMPKKYGKGIWIPAQDSKLQAVICVDSYAAMNPLAQDEDESSNALAVAARAFAKQLPRVKGRMLQKMVAVIGTNLLGDIPMAMYGPTQNEKGGKALKGFSDVRVWFTKRSLSAPPFNPKPGKKISSEIEASVTGEGTDRYRYIHIKAVKNKLSMPNREAYLRIWEEDGEGVARGLDPVFDTIFYLRETGQLTGKRSKFELNLDGIPTKKFVTWEQLKGWILKDKAYKVALCKHLGIKKPFDIRIFCFRQMEKGIGEKLYIAANIDKHSIKKGEEDDE